MNDMTNPKDLLGLKKVQIGLMPAAGVIQGALAMTNGAKKYGPYNWRTKSVRMSIYLDAIERHVMALRDGENVAADSGVSHLGHIIACGAILADAVAGDFLVDDRPPPGPASKLIAETEIKASGTATPSPAHTDIYKPVAEFLRAEAEAVSRRVAEPQQVSRQRRPASRKAAPRSDWDLG